MVNLGELVIEITNYETLLQAAQQQSAPQRFLFVFVKSSLPEDASDEEKTNFEAGSGGGLEPVMCVDKPLSELSTFKNLVTESEEMGKDWHLVLIACLGGVNGKMPTSEDCEKPLDIIVQNVQQGGDLSGYMAFDRDGNPLQFG